jgi:7,8-dihydropterin-6-yl-methyl-4-(beta-D-ribofuranosyl)aminobenzene 5'-phosphate synthase
MYALGVVLLAATLVEPPARDSTAGTRVTILVDAFGGRADLRLDWGFAALVEHGGRRILFDTGNQADVLAHNAAALGIDLKDLDFVVVSHRHGDHTDGLHHLRQVNPRIRVYAPNDEYFGGLTPPKLFRRPAVELPDSMRYFAGQPPGRVAHGTPWRGLDITLVERTLAVAPGIRVVFAGGERSGTGDIPELALAIDTPEGQVLLVGCAHPGLQAMLEAADARSRPVALLAGGFHWAVLPDSEITHLATELRDEWRIRAVAPGHCTSEPGFVALRKAFGRRHRYAGVGSALLVP